MSSRDNIKNNVFFAALVLIAICGMAALLIHTIEGILIFITLGIVIYLFAKGEKKK